MRGVNKITLIGNTGNDPEIKYSQGGDAFARFSLATTEQWKDKQSGEKKERVEWHRCIASGKLAEIIGEYVKKGDPVYVEGSVRYSKYTDKDGVEKQSTDIRVNEMRLLGGKRDGERQAGTTAQRKDPAPAKPATFDDVPFDDDILF